MSKKLFFLLSLILALFHNQLTPFVSYAWWQKDGKNLLVLGDAHSSELNFINIPHITFLTNSLELFFKENKPKKNDIICLIEDENNDQKYEKMAPTLKIIKEHFTKNPALKEFYKNIDYRDESKSLINSFFNTIQDVLKASKTKIEFKALLTKTSESLLQKTIHDITVGSYLAYLEKTLEDIEKWLNQARNMPFSAYFNLIKFLYTEAIQKTKLILLQKHKPQTNFLFALIEIISEYYQDKEKLSQIADKFLHDLDYRFAEAGFMHEIMISTTKNTTTLLVVGQVHAVKINSHLSSAGFKQKSEKNIYHMYNLFKTGVEIDLLGSFEEMLIETIQLVLPAQIKAVLSKKCSNPYCRQREGDIRMDKIDERLELLRCTRCKNTKYCNKSCQTQHWKLGHREICKKTDNPEQSSGADGAGRA